MTEARGIHAHPTLKLGKRPPIPGRKSVSFGAFVRTIPDHPLVDAAPSLAYPMDRNDVAGDCVVAGSDHALQVICHLLGVERANWTDSELLAYYQTQNPDFRSWADGNTNADGGMVIQSFLEYLVAKGVILAFAKIDQTNAEEMRAAIYLGLAIITGEDLRVAQQSQQVWDYVDTPDWGGHCTTTVGYPNPQRQTAVSWGALIDMTEHFIVRQMDEAWFILTQAHVDHPGFRNHFNLPAFAAAVSDLTGGKVVVPVPPAPAPAPTPVPTPTPEPTPPAPTPVPVPSSTSVQFTEEQFAAIEAWSKSRFCKGAHAAREAWKAATN